MAKKLRLLAVAMLSCAAIGCGEGRTAEPRDEPQSQAANPDAPILRDFHDRIEQYMALHRKVAKEVPRLKETDDPGKIDATQTAIAAKIREARAGAGPGEIFTPDIRRVFRRLMYPELTGPDAAGTKAALREEKSEMKHVPLAVNAEYPDTAPLPTVPPNLLAALPTLPEDLEYRIVGRNLILHDIDANIIVDYIENAIR